jgi:hypothetical protein
MEYHWFFSGSKEISLYTLETITTHTLYVLDQHQSQLLLHSVHCNSVSTIIDARKIILWCCILPTRTCKLRSLGVKNTNHCLSHQNGNLLPSLWMLHHTCTHHCSCFTQCHEMGSRWFHCGWMETLELYILGNSTTHTYTLHYIYILHTSLFSLSS